MADVLDTVSGWLTLYGLKIIVAVVILAVGFTVAKTVVKVFRKILAKAKVDETLVSFGGNLLKFVLYAFVIIAALNQAGFQTTSLIAVLGAASLAVGLSLKDQLSSLAAGVLILITRPFKLGDMVEVGGIMGTVEAITILNTKLMGFDGRAFTMPNTKVYSDKIVNYFTTPTRRIDLVVGIGYDDDIKKAKDILLELMQADDRVLTNPSPSVVVSELGDSSVNLAVRPWVANADFWAVRCSLLEEAKLRFDAEGISIPYPQTDVHLFTASGQADQDAA